MNRSSRPRFRIGFELLESRDTPASNFPAFGAAPGGLPLVAVYRPDGTALAEFQAFETGFTGGVRVAAGELDGDPNTLEVVAAAGPGGGPRVSVFQVNLSTGAVAPLVSFFAFEPTFTGGTTVAVGNVANEANRQEIVVGAGDGGGPAVKVYDLNDGTTIAPAPGPLSAFFPFESSFRGGVRVAAGELDGNAADGDELLVAAGPGGGPRVRVFRSDGAVLADFYSYDTSFLGGTQVGVASTGTAGVPALDAYALDPSQRNAALNGLAGVGVTATPAATPAATANALTATGTNAANFGSTTIAANTAGTNSLSATGLGTNTAGVTGLGTNGLNTAGLATNLSTLGTVNPTFGPTGSTFTTGFGNGLSTNGFGATALGTNNFGATGTGTALTTGGTAGSTSFFSSTSGFFNTPENAIFNATPAAISTATTGAGLPTTPTVRAVGTTYTNSGYPLVTSGITGATGVGNTSTALNTAGTTGTAGGLAFGPYGDPGVLTPFPSLYTIAYPTNSFTAATSATTL